MRHIIGLMAVIGLIALFVWADQADKAKGNDERQLFIFIACVGAAVIMIVSIGGMT